MHRVVTLFSGIGAPECAMPDGMNFIAQAEINPHACKVLQTHLGNAFNNLGSVSDIPSLPAETSVLIAGFPCKRLSVAQTISKKGLGEGESALFFDAVRLLETLHPSGFYIFENVASMRKCDRDAITAALDDVAAKKGWTTHLTEIDAAAFSPMRRKRLFWTNFAVAHPRPQEAKQHGAIYCSIAEISAWPDQKRVQTYMDAKVGKHPRWRKGFHHIIDASGRPANAMPCITAAASKGLPYNLVVDARNAGNVYRKWAPVELERCLGFPDGWTSSIATTRRYECLGNTMNVDVMRHIMQQIPNRI